MRFVENGFSLKISFVLIVLSRTYQSGSDLNEQEILPTEYDAAIICQNSDAKIDGRADSRRQSQVLGLPAEFEGYDPGTRAGQIAGVQRVRCKFADGDIFLRQFGKLERLLACECERSDQLTLGQALSLVGGESLHERLENPHNRIGALLASSDSPCDVIDDLVWTALTRPPDASGANGNLRTDRKNRRCEGSSRRLYLGVIERERTDFPQLICSFWFFQCFGKTLSNEFGLLELEK